MQLGEHTSRGMKFGGNHGLQEAEEAEEVTSIPSGAMVARQTVNLRVAGSSPASGASCGGSGLQRGLISPAFRIRFPAPLPIRCIPLREG